MATILKIKRSTGSGAPTTGQLVEGELAYSQDKSNDGANAILYIESINNADQEVIHKVGGKYYTDLVDAATSDTIDSAIVKRDSLGSFSANVVTANVFAGEAASAIIATTANALTTSRSINLAGDLEGNVIFDGSTDVTIYANVVPDSVALGTDTTGDYLSNVLEGTGIVITGQGGETATPTINLADTSVTAATYGGSNDIPVFTVDAQGRLTYAGNSTISTTLNIDSDSGSNAFSLLNDVLSIRGTAPGLFTSITDNVITFTNTGVTELTSAGHGIVASAATGNVQLTFTGVGSIAGTTNEIEVDQSTGNVTIGLPNDVTIGNDLTVTGNLFVLGSATAVSTNELVVDDPLVKFGNANPTSALDIGFYGEYTSGGLKYAGLYADASESYLFKLFKDLTVDPSGNVVDFSNATQATLQADLTAGNVTSLVNALLVDSGGTGRKTLTANAVLYGDGTNAVGLASGTSGQVLQIDADGAVKFDIIDGGSY